MSLLVIALDPGTTTGYATLREDRSKVIDYGQISGGPNGEIGVMVEVYRKLQRLQPTHIVCESFHYRQGGPRAKVVLTPAQVIGVVQLYVGLSKEPPELIFQTPSQGKGFWTDEKLKACGYKSTTAGMPHARDALRHLLYYMTFARKDQTWLRALK